MAIQHLQFGNSTPDAQRLRNGIAMLEQGIDICVKELATMLTRVAGADPTNIANFDEVVIRYGIGDHQTGQVPTDAQRTIAQGLYYELASDIGKLTTDASVSYVKSALGQLFNYTR